MKTINFLKKFIKSVHNYITKLHHTSGREGQEMQ